MKWHIQLMLIFGWLTLAFLICLLILIVDLFGEDIAGLKNLAKFIHKLKGKEIIYFDIADLKKGIANLCEPILNFVAKILHRGKNEKENP